jgi:hypothetical protein
VIGCPRENVVEAPKSRVLSVAVGMQVAVRHGDDLTQSKPKVIEQTPRRSRLGWYRSSIESSIGDVSCRADTASGPFFVVPRHYYGN